MKLIVQPDAGVAPIVTSIKQARATIDILIFRLDLQEITVIGRLGSNKAALSAERYPGKRLHIRAIIVDGRRAFLGSQSLRRIELDERREIGVIVTDGSLVKQMQAVFEEDWAQTDPGKRTAKAADKAPEDQATADSRI
jgi:PLD-like domain